MKHPISITLIVIALLSSIALVGSYNAPTEAQSETLTPTGSGIVLSTVNATDDLSTDAATDSATEEANRVMIQVVSSVANFRTGPGTNYPVVTWVYRGNKILLSGISEDSGWYVFPFNKRNTWISADNTITTLLEGDPSTLPVIETPPTPTPRPTSDGSYSSSNPRTCNFDNSMSVDDQNNLLQQVYDTVDANDWHQAGQLARRLYRCAPDITFYLLHDIYLPSHPESAGAATNLDTAYAQFYAGWIGQ